uniref:ditrans,polycis-polyprenyl diphosphate synthase [(2E,6E)-farnesyldiphosphate specific] n=1 Tax=Diabrotica virgifera virgifera TaxID=50390 RepID=A0A6P7FJK3_DIAVI
MPVIDGYKVLYILLHSLYTIFENIWRTLLFIYQNCIRVINPESTFDDADQLKKRLSRLTKKPQHLTIIIGVEECSLVDLANLVYWCLGLNIPYVSFYDYKGNLKKHEEKLQQIVESRKSENINIIWHTHAEQRHKNGFLGPKIHVKVLTHADGKQSIVNVTKKLALNKEKDISKEKISELLLRQYEFPDPEMAIICGKKLNIYNYPPWQLRLTEFFKVNKVNNITFPVFVEKLEKYSKCEQRVGK